MVISFLKAANLAGGEQQIDEVHSVGSLNQGKHILIISQSPRHGPEKIEIQNDELIFLCQTPTPMKFRRKPATRKM